MQPPKQCQAETVLASMPDVLQAARAEHVVVVAGDDEVQPVAIRLPVQPVDRQLEHAGEVPAIVRFHVPIWLAGQRDGLDVGGQHREGIRLMRPRLHGLLQRGQLALIVGRRGAAQKARLAQWTHLKELAGTPPPGRLCLELVDIPRQPGVFSFKLLEPLLHFPQRAKEFIAGRDGSHARRSRQQHRRRRVLGNRLRSAAGGGLDGGGEFGAICRVRQDFGFFAIFARQARPRGDHVRSLRRRIVRSAG
jgi:hypothetical protein